MFLLVATPLARRPLKPLDQMTDTASTISVGNLSSRLDVPQTGDALERLSRTLNEMFDRLYVSVRRIDQFSADASHEFRTPQSVIRTTAELALKHGRTEAEYAHDPGQIKAEAERLTDLIEVMLTLAREGVNTSAVAQHQLDLTHLIRDIYG